MKLEIEMSKYSEDSLFSSVHQALVTHFTNQFKSEIDKLMREEFSAELRKKTREEFGKIVSEMKIGDYTFKDYLMGLLMRPGGHKWEVSKPRIQALLEDLVDRKAQEIFRELFNSKVEDLKKDLASHVGEMVLSRLR